MDAPIPTLLMLQGLPASGKTTYARKLVEQGNWIRVNKDDLRKMMDAGFSRDNEKRIIRIRNQIIIDALSMQKNVVVDDTNFAPVHLETLRQLAQQMSANFKVTFMDTPLETCLMRNAKRDEPVPQTVITDMYDRYIKPHKEEKEVEPEEELEEAIIVDVDGTLAHIDKEKPRNVYDASRAMEDLLDDAVSNVAGMAYQNGYKVIILTGRHSGHLDVTKEWLDHHGINYDEIYSRQEGDRRSDVDVKQELYEQNVKGRYKVKYVIDDRPKVCRMWRALGLHVFQVGDPDHDF